MHSVLFLNELNLLIVKRAYVMRVQQNRARLILSGFSVLKALTLFLQPPSQGSLLPPYEARERETLENAGHVAPEQN